MRIVITGPTGAVGRALIAECLKQDAEILVICRKSSKRTDELCKQYSSIQNKKDRRSMEFLYLSLDEYDDYVNHMRLHKTSGEAAYDVFYHLSWMGTTGEERNRRELQNKNTEYALSAVRLAHALGCHTFVGAGSQAEYGRVQGMLAADTATNPETEYGRAKLEAGMKTRSLCRELGIRHIWTRILSVYGPHDGDTSMVMQAIQCMREGKEARFTKGEQQWDYLYSGDAAEALFLLGKKGTDGRIYPLGSGRTMALSEYISIIRKVINPDAKVSLGAVPYSEKQVMYLCADISGLTKDTGFTPHTEFEEGIKNTLAAINQQQTPSV